MSRESSKGDDEKLLRKVEETLAEIDREQGLSDHHLEVLAALRIRIFGAPKKTLDDAIEAAGQMKGRKSLEELKEPEKTSSLDDAFEKGPKKGKSLDEIL